MKRVLLPLAMSFFIAPASYADAIYQCPAGAGVILQSAPCNDDNSNAATPEPPSKEAVDAENATTVRGPSVGPAPPVPVALVKPANPTVGEELPVGITDMQVLNNRRWGKPQAITRNREARAWHEYWQYKTGANGGKLLHFVNGRLVDINDLEPAMQTEGLVPVATSVAVLEER